MRATEKICVIKGNIYLRVLTIENRFQFPQATKAMTKQLEQKCNKKKKRMIIKSNVLAFSSIS